MLLVTIFLPLACFYLLTTLGKIDSIMVTNVSQRKIPLILQIVLTLFLILKSITFTETPELYYFFIGSIISSVLALIFVFLKLKASLHMVGMTSLTAFSIGCCIQFHVFGISFISILILLNGVVAYSRLSMKAHSIEELFYGFLIGLIPQTILMCFWL